MSSGAGFPINDLLRRRFQTSLTISVFTLSVASTLFLLFFSSRLGFGFSADARGTLTLGLTAIFSQFLVFVGVLVFVVGAVLTSFIVFLMMAQRIRDFGLIKAAGCPNALVGGYFVTELLTVTFWGCILGVACGFGADYAFANLFLGGYTLPVWWFAPILFVAFFGLAVIFGLQPILKAAKMSPLAALSPVTYYSSVAEGKHKALSHAALSWRLASRSLIRRLSATVRIVVLLSAVFALLTVAVAGGVIANDTTNSWVQRTIGESSIAVTHTEMGEQYQMLLAAFSGAKPAANFNYSNPKLGIPNAATQKIASMSDVKTVDPRLVTYQHLKEIGNFTIPPGSLQVIPVGDSREGDALVVGVTPQSVSDLPSKGRPIEAENEALIGDAVAQTMYYPHPDRYIMLSDPLVESFECQNTTFTL